MNDNIGSSTGPGPIESKPTPTGGTIEVFEDSYGNKIVITRDAFGHEISRTQG